MKITVENMHQFREIRKLIVEFIKCNPAERVYVRVGKGFEGGR